MQPIWYSMKGNPIPYDPDNTVTGYLPGFLNDADPLSAQEQFDNNYQSGFMVMDGFKTADQQRLIYPGDPPFRALAKCQLRDETIVLYDAEIVCIFQPDGTYKCARMS